MRVHILCDGWVGEGAGSGARYCFFIGRCSQCPGHSLWEEAGCRRRPSLAAGLQQARGPKLDSALCKTPPVLKSKTKS